jgi:hypothetical protein
MPSYVRSCGPQGLVQFEIQGRKTGTKLARRGETPTLFESPGRFGFFQSPSDVVQLAFPFL